MLDTSLTYLKGVGPQKAELLSQEIDVRTFSDLLSYYPFRYDDRTKFYTISQLDESGMNMQLRIRILHFQTVGQGNKTRFVATAADSTGEIELVWFQGSKYIQQKLKKGVEYVVFGKPVKYGKTYSIAHPEIEPATENNIKGHFLQPVYPLTEGLKRKFIDSRALNKMMRLALADCLPFIRENLPAYLLREEKLIDKVGAVTGIHFPKDPTHLQAATTRLKFEELLKIQLKLIKLKQVRTEKFRGFLFDNSRLVQIFYNEYLPFSLTNAQKRVVKEIYADCRTGNQMNRLIQGDVGSGKTIVAMLAMLIAISNSTQCAFMAPTEILAEQHFNGLRPFATSMNLNIGLLTGSTKASHRKELLENLETGGIDILVGTHALLEERVKFKVLGLAVIDEQHRFGVAQRARLWQKNSEIYPHVLIMTATPIPRTLAMTVYGDLEISNIDELPQGRKPIITRHLRDAQRIQMFAFVEEQLSKGRQAYLVYPLIEESEKLDFKDLMDGYESIARRFPEIPISILHGKMKPQDKELEMSRFLKGETRILVATTVIEVGVNVPNATVMVIENAERFGLSQLHQLRGRVGRGADQSYCLLMTGDKLTHESRQRIKTMTETTDGFIIAETDLKLRGPGDLSGTRQSGGIDLKIANLATDGDLLASARIQAKRILSEDPDLLQAHHRLLKEELISENKGIEIDWGNIG